MHPRCPVRVRAAHGEPGKRSCAAYGECGYSAAGAEKPRDRIAERRWHHAARRRGRSSTVRMRRRMCCSCPTPRGPRLWTPPGYAEPPSGRHHLHASRIPGYPLSMTRHSSILLALALGLAPAALRAQSAADSGTFIILHASDTVATERFARSETGITGTLAIRNAVALSQGYIADPCARRDRPADRPHRPGGPGQRQGQGQGGLAITRHLQGGQCGGG